MATWTLGVDDDGWPEIRDENDSLIWLSFFGGLADANRYATQIVTDHNAASAYRELQEAAEAAIKGKVLSNWATEGVWVCLVCGLEAREEHELIHDEDCWYAALRAALASVKGEGA